MVIITGMHRSGTSLVAKLFFEAGADMGSEETFFQPDRWNPHGYFEQIDIIRVNEALIHGALWKFIYFRLPSAKVIMRKASKLADRIQQTALKYRGCVVKEPHFCLTLHAWLKYGIGIEKVIICLRDPICVAKSIQRRNKITLRHAYRLWVTHNRRLLEYIKDVPARFVYYNNLLNEGTFFDEIIPVFRFAGLNVSKKKVSLLRKFIVQPATDENYRQAEYTNDVKFLWNNLMGRHADQFREGLNHG